MKRFFILMAMLGLCAPAFAAKEGKESFKEHLQNHYKFYGFIRNYFTFDTRESKGGTADLFYWMPLDNKWNYATQEAADLAGEPRQDLNQINQFRFLSLTSRVGVDVSGYKIAGMEFGAKVEADFYAGLTKSTGTAQLRLRQAFLTAAWKELGADQKQSAVLKVGQAWHPMAADMPDIYSLEAGAPFGPFSRTPLASVDYSINEHWTFTAAAIWQMQYTSNGPAKSSADYMKYSCTPEIYAGVTFKDGPFLGRVGYDMVSIKPRNVEGNHKVNTRQTSSLGFVYLQYKKDLFAAKFKTTIGQAGEHFGLMSGYVDYMDKDGNMKYASLNSSSTWLSLSYGKKLIGSLFLGYSENLGTSKEVEWQNIYYNKNTASEIYVRGDGQTLVGRLFRIEPEVTYNIGKFQVGLEYMLTGAQYGSFAVSNSAADIISATKHALAKDNLHWVMNHRVQAIVKFTF